MAAAPKTLPDNGLITHSDPRSPIAEAYRTIRTNIQFSSVDAALKTMLVTSAGPGEGKSTTLANLAITMAQTGQQVLIVDCDLRKPSQHRMFRLPQAPGLTSLLVEGQYPADMHIRPTQVPNLSLLPSGPLPPNPAELLQSRHMERVLEALKARADVLLFDTPPLIAVTDAAVLATKVDGTLLVIKAGHTRREMVKSAKDLLERVHARVLGVVLNNVEVRGDFYYYYEEQPEAS